METDDRVTLVVGSDTVVHYDPSVPGSSRAGSVKLKAHDTTLIKIDFAEEDLEAACIMRWRSKSQPYEIVAGSALAGGLSASYSCEQPQVCYTTKDNVLYAIALDFPENELRLNAGEFTDATKATLLGCEKILPCHKEGKWLVIDVTSLKYNDLKSSAAWVFKIEK